MVGVRVIKRVWGGWSLLKDSMLFIATGRTADEGCCGGVSKRTTIELALSTNPLVLVWKGFRDSILKSQSSKPISISPSYCLPETPLLFNSAPQTCPSKTRQQWRAMSRLAPFSVLKIDLQDTWLSQPPSPSTYHMLKVSATTNAKDGLPLGFPRHSKSQQ